MKTLIEKLKGLTFKEILIMLLRRYIFYINWIGEYEFVLNNYNKVEKCEKINIKILKQNDYAKLLPVSPYLNKKIIDELSKCQAICIAAEKRNEIVGCTWMIPGPKKYYFGELKRKINIEQFDYFITQNFVKKKCRGKKILGSMILYFVKKYLNEKGRIWGYIYNWNNSSVKALKKIGWKHKRNVGFGKILGIKIKLLKDKSTKVGYKKQERISVMGHRITKVD